MSEFLRFRCPEGHPLKAPATATGRKIRCPRCQCVFPIPLPAAVEPVSLQEEAGATLRNETPPSPFALAVGSLASLALASAAWALLALVVLARLVSHLPSSARGVCTGFLVCAAASVVLLVGAGIQLLRRRHLNVWCAVMAVVGLFDLVTRAVSLLRMPSTGAMKGGIVLGGLLDLAVVGGAVNVLLKMSRRATEEAVTEGGRAGRIPVVGAALVALAVMGSELYFFVGLTEVLGARSGRIQTARTAQSRPTRPGGVNSDDWRTDPAAFAESMRLTRMPLPTSPDNPVRWTAVFLKMTERRVFFDLPPLSDSRGQKGQLEFTCDKSDAAAWRGVTPGTRVRFTAQWTGREFRIGNIVNPDGSRSPLPPGVPAFRYPFTNLRLVGRVVP